MGNRKNYKNEKKSSLIGRIILCIFLSLSVCLLSYIIFNTNYLTPSINEVTAGYISFNNKNTTDMLKINNIKKMSDKKGRSSFNRNYLKLNITGEKNLKYEIIIYPITNNIPYQNVKFLLTNKKEEISNTLDSLENREDGGMILYQGTMNNSTMYLRLWIDENYNEKVKENSFEIKIRPR